MRTVYEYFVALFGYGYFSFFCIVLTVVAPLVRLLAGRRRAQWFVRQYMYYILRSVFTLLVYSGLVRVDFKALDRLRGERSLVFVANHPCLMDAMFVCSRLPNVACVMKGAVLKNPLLFGGAWVGGFIASDSPGHFLEQSREALYNGEQLLFFPEGTRTRGDSVNPFKGGFALVAKTTGASVQTLLIDANTPFLCKHWPLWKKPPFPLEYRITLGKQFQPDPARSHRAMTTAVERYFKQRVRGRRISLTENV